MHLSQKINTRYAFGFPLHACPIDHTITIMMVFEIANEIVMFDIQIG
jgi:hypothetical protein